MAADRGESFSQTSLGRGKDLLYGRANPPTFATDSQFDPALAEGGEEPSYGSHHAKE